MSACTDCEQLEAALGNVIDERETYSDLLDEMTDAIAVLLGVHFGEHSSVNNPWRNAIAALKESCLR